MESIEEKLNGNCPICSGPVQCGICGAEFDPSSISEDLREKITAIQNNAGQGKATLITENLDLQKQLAEVEHQRDGLQVKLDVTEHVREKLLTSLNVERKRVATTLKAISEILNACGCPCTEEGLKQVEIIARAAEKEDDEVTHQRKCPRCGNELSWIPAPMSYWVCRRETCMYVLALRPFVAPVTEREGE